MTTLTLRCLTSLRDNGDATSSELAAALKEKPHTVRATLTNLKVAGCVRVVGERPAERGGRTVASIYSFVTLPYEQGRNWGGKRRQSAPERAAPRQERQRGQKAAPITHGRGYIWGQRVGGQLV